MSEEDYYDFSFTYNFKEDEVITLIRVLLDHEEDTLVNNIIKAYIKDKLERERGER